MLWVFSYCLFFFESCGSVSSKLLNKLPYGQEAYCDNYVYDRDYRRSIVEVTGLRITHVCFACLFYVEVHCRGVQHACRALA